MATMEVASNRFATFLTRPSNDKLGVSKKGLSPLDLPPGLRPKIAIAWRHRLEDRMYNSPLYNYRLLYNYN